MKKLVILFLLLPLLVSAQVVFDGEFESGNIASVSTTDSINYFVTTKEDIGGRWFYFRISGVENRFLKVTVTNSDVNRPFYSYDNRNFTRFTESESPNFNMFQKTFEEDTVYVAYYNPYTFSYLQERISEWSQYNFVTVDTLGYTNHNLPMQEIIITDPAVPDQDKYQVWIHARTHPGETPGSFHFDGIVQQLLKDDDVINYYKTKIVFHLIPFVNPDGVYYGRSRTNFDFVDLEREWNKPDNETAKEALILKNRLAEINSSHVVEVFQNLHSQASSFCTFWIHSPSSTSDLFYRREYQFANLNTSDNPYFVPADYSESNLRDYFPEGWLWNNYGEQVMALTYETPYDQYSSDEWVTNENLYEIGSRLVFAIAEYLEINHPKHLVLDNKNAVVSGTWSTGSSGLEFYGDDFLWAQQGTGGSSVSFQSSAVDPGVYDVYGWWPSSSSSAFNVKYKIDAGSNNYVIEKTQKTNGGQWNFLTQAELNSQGQIIVTVDNNASGNVSADAVRLIYRGSVTGIENEQQPADFVLYQNYPNPFNPSTTIRFSLSRTSSVRLRVFNSLGELVKILVDGQLSSGQHEVIFDASSAGGGLSSGVYYYQLILDNFSQTKGMVLVK